MYINRFKKIVIKIGSSILIDEKGKPKKKWLEGFVNDIKQLLKKNKEIVIVSSGAIALGCEYLGINKKGLKIDKSQAIASIGQIELMSFYKKNFNKSKIKISQILLTLDDTEQRRRSINAKRTIDNLLKMGIIPIVNENDTTATTEIKYGDNDRLASRVSQIIGADCLILLSDVVIANGNYQNPINKIIKNNNCTWFIPKISKLDARKQWIIGSIAPKGEVIIDLGAEKAIGNGKSLLPAGVKKINGVFEKGDHILVKNLRNVECGRGLSSFSSKEIQKIKGFHSSKITSILGYSSREEIIHKDDLVKV